MPYVHLALEETPRYENAPSTTPYRVSTSGVYIPTTGALIGPSPDHLNRDSEQRGNLSPTPRLVSGFAPAGRIAEAAYVNHMVWMLSLAGFAPTFAAGAGTNEVQTVAQGGTWTGGTFTLTFGAQTTAPIAYNATAATVQAALELLSTIGAGNVVCAGGPLPSSGVTVTFVGALSATNVAALTGTATGLTGTAPTVSITETTPGAAGAVLDPDGKGVPTGATKVTFAKRAAGAGIQAAQATVEWEPASGINGGFWRRGQGFAISQLGLSGAGQVSADLVGLVCTPVNDPGLTPSYDSLAIEPVREGDLLINWLSGGACINGFNVQVAQPLAREKCYGFARSLFPQQLLAAREGVTTVSGSIDKSAIDRQDEDALMDARTFSATASWRSRSKVAASGAYYQLWLEMPACQILGGDPAESMNALRYPASFQWQAAYSEASGYDARFTIVAGVTAAGLATYV